MIRTFKEDFDAFSGYSALGELSFGSRMENIGDEAFSDCINLTQIISSAVTPLTCGTQALDDSTSGIVLKCFSGNS